MSRVPKRLANKVAETRNLAIGYTRVSTMEQADEGVSLQQQREAILLYGESRGFSFGWGGSTIGSDGYTVLIERGVSGGTPLIDRPEGAKLASLVRSGKVGHVVATKLDRLFRSAADSAEWVGELDKHGVSLHLLDLGGSAVDTSTTSGRLVVGVLSQVAEMVRGTIKDNTRAGMRHKKKHCEYCGGGTPYGFRVVTSPGGVLVLEQDQKEQAMIQRARVLRRSGLSLLRIGETLTKEGHKPRSGGPWGHETIRRLVYEEVNDGS
jgi:DNA invertase Pin-like site-specific DNA recombinase